HRRYDAWADAASRDRGPGGADGHAPRTEEVRRERRRSGQEAVVVPTRDAPDSTEAGAVRRKQLTNELIGISVAPAPRTKVASPPRSSVLSDPAVAAEPRPRGRKEGQYEQALEVCSDPDDARGRRAVDRRGAVARSVSRCDAQALVGARRVDAALHRERRGRPARQGRDDAAAAPEPDRYRRCDRAVLRTGRRRQAHESVAEPHPDRRGTRRRGQGGQHHSGG